MLDKHTHTLIAERLNQAEKQREQIRAISLDHPTITIEDAYAVQREWVKMKIAEGRVLKGHKIGLTSKAMQASSQISEPDYGALLDDMFFHDGGDIPTDRFIVPRIEVELAFVLAKPLRGPNCTIFDVYNATDYVIPALELIDAYQCGAAIATKSDLIVRDGDILDSIARHSPVICKLTITTTDDALAARLEPGAPSPSRRLAALRELADRGLFAGVLLMPVLPFLEDTEENVLEVVERAAEAGASFVYPALGVTMREGQREYFLQGLEDAFPGQGLRARYLRRYGDRYWCASPRARRLWEVFSHRCGQLGMRYRMEQIVSAATRDYGDRQLSFFLTENTEKERDR